MPLFLYSRHRILRFRPHQPACCPLQPFPCPVDKEFCFLVHAGLVLSTSAFFLSTGQIIQLFRPRQPAPVRPSSYEPFSCPPPSFFEMILHCRALRATLSAILNDHKNIFGQSRNSALSAVGRDVAGGRKRSAAVLFRIRCQLRRIPFLACLLGGRNLHESERISS